MKTKDLYLHPFCLWKENTRKSHVLADHSDLYLIPFLFDLILFYESKLVEKAIF